MPAVAYLVVANPSAKNNLGTLIRCASAFAVEEVVVVGSSKWSTHGAHGSNKHVRYRRFEDWESAATFLRAERGCDLCGIVAQSRNTSMGSAPPPPPPPPSGSAASTAAVVVKAASPARAAAAAADDAGAENADHPEGGGEAKDNTAGAAGARGSTPTGREHEKPSAAEQRTDGAVIERPEEHPSPSCSTIEQPRQQSSKQEEDQEPDHGKRTGAASVAVRRRPFRRSTAFLVGHRNRLEEEALRVCNFLVHIEQAASEFSVELGAPVTTSIALHHFTAWARYEEREFTGEKFNVDRGAARCCPPVQQGNPLAEERVRLREELRASDPLGHEGNAGDDCGGGLGWLEAGGSDDSCQGDY